MFQLKIVFLITMGVLAIVNGEDKPISPSAKIPIDNAISEQILTETFKELAKIDGPYYTVSKMNSASLEFLAGLLFEFNADLLEKNQEKIKTCDIELLVESFLKDGARVTFKCPGEEDVIKRFTPTFG